MGKNREDSRLSAAVSRILALQRQNDVIQLLLEGKERKEILQYIGSKYRLTLKTSQACVTDAANILKERSNFEVNNMISLHIQRYEAIYALLYQIKSYGMAMSALRAKEKILGFHKDGFHMRVNSGTISSVQLQTVQGEYDVMRLTKEKQNRMTELMQKAKRK